MNRRQLLTVLGVAGVFLSAAIYRSGPSTRGADAGRAGYRLVASIDALPEAAAIGRAYLDAHADDRDAVHLTNQIIERLRRGKEDSTHAARRRLRRAISREIRQDFASNRVVSVNGWILSDTEAKLCGLAALHAV